MHAWNYMLGSEHYNTTNETALKMKMLKLDEFEIRNTNF